MTVSEETLHFYIIFSWLLLSCDNPFHCHFNSYAITRQLSPRHEKTKQTLCVCRCFLTFDFCAKARPQTIHWNGFSPVCVRVCCWRSKFFVNDLSQYWQWSVRGAVDVLLASTTDGFTRRWGRLTASLPAIVVTDSSPRAANSTKHQPINLTDTTSRRLSQQALCWLGSV